MRHITFFIHILLICLTFFVYSCAEDISPQEREYKENILEHRKEKDDFMKNDPASPFNAKGKVEFHPLKYYDPDPEFRFESRLYEYEDKDTVIIFGTKGEERMTVKYGYLRIPFENEIHNLNVYKAESRDGNIYYGVWFTDETTGEATYEVGRYIDFDFEENPDFVYTVDFNLAYNPYCSYSPNYSCAVPTKEDHLNFAVTAGEKKFHF